MSQNAGTNATSLKGSFGQRAIGAAFLVVSLAVLVMGCIGPLALGHDLQRVGQVLIGVFALICLVPGPSAGAAWYCEGQTRLIAGLVVLVGIVSALRATQPLWALTEIALLICSVCIASAVAQERLRRGVALDRWLMVFVMALCALKAGQFLLATVHAFGDTRLGLNTDVLLEGFSNKRFYGQFQTLTLPLLALPLLLIGGRRSIKVVAFALLALWWLVAVSGGTRGTWLGLAVAAFVMCVLGRNGRRWLGWQVGTALVGGMLFWLVFQVLTDYLGIRVQNFAGDRLNSSLSLREIIWQQAWDMIRERPWLGFGPMHFADIANPIAAHPHQAVLQWASEWGVPSALCVAWLVLRGMFATIRLIREKADSQEPADLLRLCLFASLVGALTQSMVDGVIVMPYSQLWLALVVGWLLGLHRWSSEPAAVGSALRWSGRFVSVAAVALLVWVVLRDVPHLQERNEQYARDFGGHFQPRFWAQGVIAQKHP